MNYRQIFAKRQKLMNRIKTICPEMQDVSGIYTFHKIDENGFKKYYSGQAKHLLQRTSSHLSEYDHIALSLKKYGFKKEGNPYGWELDYFYCKESELNDKEQETIAHWHKDLGYIPYNKTGGSQGAGKFGINENKPSKTYHDGVKYGREKLKKELNVLIDKYLIINTKNESKLAQNALIKFNDLLQEEE